MCYINVSRVGLDILLAYEMGIEMKTIFLQNLTGGLFGGILKGLLKNRLNGLFTTTPTVAVLLLTAVIAACASGDPKQVIPLPLPPPLPLQPTARLLKMLVAL